MRAAVFSRRELRVLTEAMNNMPSGRYVSNEVKLRAYQRVHRYLRQRFQKHRTTVQLQRRWSDLRRRQPQLLQELRQEITGHAGNDSNAVVEAEKEEAPAVVEAAEAEEEEAGVEAETEAEEEEAEDVQRQQVSGQAEAYAEASPEAEEQGEGQEEVEEGSQPEELFSPCASGAGDWSVEEPEPHQDFEEADSQLVLAQAAEAIVDTPEEEVRDCQPPPPTAEKLFAKMGHFIGNLEAVINQLAQFVADWKTTLAYRASLPK
ncbi:uncharacterized protein LOC142101841 [Mixophyes fleayi]|uniref:uncharacterized protein LOC142101841 n=1 Tax=Mixophyes fleayi TaxID=3061075 RepID=UPI003F4DC60C